MAIQINLLDWRAERRAVRQKQFVVLMAAAGVLGAGIVLASVMWMNGNISHQTDRNERLRQEITAIDKKIQEIQELERVKANLLARMQVIEQLQASRSATVHFFDELVNTLPDGVYLQNVKQTGSVITVNGIAESNGRVSSYMKNLDASLWFKNPVLVVIKTTEKDRIRQSEFQLTVNVLTKPKTDSDPETNDNEISDGEIIE